ncbi:hypothetical protein [Bacillus multifaciens]|uniref:hypothetical protein n=1 Tax=Bacillus multifaciens TaxID=3068506 RepID=UPI002741FE47|nr:hypothetical protein [Bacillus sp. WLY-B-L8]MDP7980617.1 hypothetical protein [Bacillus sp. WLY-B-L8]
MRKKISWNNLMLLVSLGTFGALLSGIATSIPNNIVSWGILAVGIVLTFGASLTGLYLLKKNRVY